MICDLNTDPRMDERKLTVSKKEIKLEERTVMDVYMGEGGGDHHQSGGSDGGGGEDDMLDEPEIDGNLIFSDDAFPSLPDFPCLSSPSCSSSFAGCPSSSTSSSSSSSSASTSLSTSSCNSSSWSMVKGNKDQDHEQQPSAAPTSTDDGSMEVVPQAESGNQQGLESDGSVDLLAGMDLLDEEFWDPSSLFPDESSVEQQAAAAPSQDMQYSGLEGGGGGYSEDLAMVFYEWLKSNKETISPEDLKSIKLKRSTIECAARRLGGGKEGMKQLLKLILAWVQNYHFQKRHLGSSAAAADDLYQHQHISQMIHVPVTTNSHDPNPNTNPIYDNFPPCSTWVPTADPAVGGFPSPMGYVGVGGRGGGEVVYSSSTTAVPSPLGTNDNSATLHAVDPISTWPPAHYSPQYPPFPTPPGQFPPPVQPPYLGGFGTQYAMSQFFLPGQGEQLVRLASSATKEARKKRMARQRRFLSMHHHRNHQHQHPPPPQHQHHHQQQHPSSSNDWVLWSSASTNSSTQMMASPLLETDTNPNSMQTQQQHQQQQPQQTNHARVNHNSERRQGWKAEKNLRFLLQKVLKQSDVGSLGRIVLPKKEAEIHLPELEARDGISLKMEDIGTSRTWNMRYRFWPNNKSRMYLLENTGDFVRSNGLQEGDFIVIYSDVKCGKYMIRGVKVRKPMDSKAEGGKNAGKPMFSQMNGQTAVATTATTTAALKRRTIQRESEMPLSHLR